MKKWIRNNSLSIVFVGLFLFSFGGQVITGWHEHNKERKDYGQAEISLPRYFHSGHFLQSTFENWESEFLQMGLFVVFTIWLRQKGSSESKSCDGPEEVDREPDPKRKDAPWPVKKGGLVLAVYKHSLTIAFLLLFTVSFILHFYGSLKDENSQLQAKGQPLESWQHYIMGSRFWFESFQNWQSEFLSVFTIVMFSIFLRQKGSPQSKPVDAPNSETGE